MIASLGRFVIAVLVLFAGVTAAGLHRAEAAVAVAEMTLFNDGQHVAVDQNFPDPVGVFLADTNEQGVPDLVVSLTIESGTATILVITHGEVAADGQSAIATTDFTGSVVAGFRAGSSPGPVVVSVRAAQQPGQQPSLPDVVKQFTLFVEPAGFVSRVIPNTGRDTSIMVVVGAACVTVGLALSTIRRRGRPLTRNSQTSKPVVEA
jgi:LPXTG-motif cell wall-anchored protein